MGLYLYWQTKNTAQIFQLCYVHVVNQITIYTKHFTNSTYRRTHRQTRTHTNIETDLWADTKTYIKIDSQPETNRRHTDTHTHTGRHRHSGKQRHTHRHIEKTLRGRHTDRHAYRQRRHRDKNTDTHIGIEDTETNTQTGTHIYTKSWIKFGHSSGYLCKTRAIFFALALFCGQTSLLQNFMK